MSEIQVLDNPFSGEIATIHGQIPIIVEDAVTQSVSITANGTYTPGTGVTGFNSVSVNVTPFITGSFTSSNATASIALTTTKQCSHVIIMQHTRALSSANTIMGQVFFTSQVASEIVNSVGTASTAGAGTVVYNATSIVVTNTVGVYSANIQYDWVAW